MENRECKKCGRPLPDDYKYKKCESCRTKQIEKIKKGMKTAGGIAGTVASIAVIIVTRGKYSPKK